MQSPQTQVNRREFLLHTLLPLLLIAIPAGIYLWFLHAFAVSLPFWDEWEFWWSMKRLDEGNWLDAFWLPHNEHRLVVTRLFYFLLRYTAALDVTLAMYFDFVLACLTLWGLWRLLRASVRVSLWYLVPVAFVVFSLEQWENILWGWQIAIYAMVCGSVWSLYLLARPGLRTLPAAILMAVVASLSFANGLMIWPAGFAYLILARSRRRLLVWCGAAAALLVVYFYDYVSQVTRPSPTGLVRPSSLAEFFAATLSQLQADPLGLPEMFFASVGALLAPQNYALAAAIGLVIVLIFLVLFILVLRTRAVWATAPLPLVALGLLSFLSSLTILVGRMGLWDKAYVLNSRYTTITLLGIVATYLLTVALAHAPQSTQRPYRRAAAWMGAVICVVIALGLPGGYRIGFVKGQALQEERLWQRAIVVQFESRSDEELSGVYPKTLRERLLYWQSRGLAPFTE
jgi:hypothetical protein